VLFRVIDTIQLDIVVPAGAELSVVNG